MNVHQAETITLDGATLTIEQVLAVAYGQPGVPSVALSAAAITQVERAADAVPPRTGRARAVEIRRG